MGMFDGLRDLMSSRSNEQNQGNIMLSDIQESFTRVYEESHASPDYLVFSPLQHRRGAKYKTYRFMRIVPTENCYRRIKRRANALKRMYGKQDIRYQGAAQCIRL